MIICNNKSVKLLVTRSLLLYTPENISNTSIQIFIASQSWCWEPLVWCHVFYVFCFLHSKWWSQLCECDI